MPPILALSTNVVNGPSFNVTVRSETLYVGRYHAYNQDSPVHDPARAWWEAAMNGSLPVGLAWVALLGFVRITTH